ncbi:hypothetical protein DM860_005783 [Cuscuta australis]|uniref:BHLH domain-containing protein n=1 Tax=Cuscuta australis TaxID=267555 RepID=A0A328DVB3_9ASTE|nr:hypothetical protein DM860_005783 [Cuscuta australis]
MDEQNMFPNDGITMPYGIGIQGSDLFGSSWQNPADPNDPFRSALSSMVSSPAASNAGRGGGNSSVRDQVFVLRELIGRLGSYDHSSGEISPVGCTPAAGYHSPPKLNLSSMAGHQIRATAFPIQPEISQHFSLDPGFAGTVSCFSGKGLIDSGKQPVKKPTPESSELGNSRENSTVSEQIPSGEICKNDTNPRKRKAAAKGKAKETRTPSPNAEASENKETLNNPKRAKTDEQKLGKANNHPKAAEPLKDYIHVRARRGQATDAHSLAERVRREKISERMKLLQDLVPGCNKVTGKAVMLDEIINYVQSLQRQVEFLSMKLATVNPRMEFNMEALLPKDLYQYPGAMAHDIFPSADATGSPIPFSFQPQHSHLHKRLDAPFPINNSSRDQLHSSMDTFLDPSSQVPAFFEDDLSSVVQMGFGQNQTLNFHGSLGTCEMKAEL